jgi:Protein of unknown function (DUF4011)
MTEKQPPARAPGRDVVRERIDDWRRRLIDLTYRNRLIRYRPTFATTLEIESPSLATLLADPYRTLPWRFFFPPEPASEEHAEEDDTAALVDELVVRAAQAAHRPPQEDEIVVRGEQNPRRINRILENLARKSNAEYQDKALRILYIAAGFLDWVDPAREEALSSPLILVPVELRRMSAREPYQLFFVDDEEITINPSLTEKLRRDVGREIPADWAWEDKPVETELAEIEEAIEGTGWSVRHDAAIGLFSFQKFVMYRDLLTNEEAIGALRLFGRSRGSNSTPTSRGSRPMSRGSSSSTKFSLLRRTSRSLTRTRRSGAVSRPRGVASRSSCMDRPGRARARRSLASSQTRSGTASVSSS